MKPLMGQVQNQAHLDDLLGSPKVKGGNFSLPAQNSSTSSAKDNSAPSFTDMLLSTINKPAQKDHNGHDLKAINNKYLAPKIPDEPRRVDRPMPKSVAPDKNPRVAVRASDTADTIPGNPRDFARSDLPESEKYSKAATQAAVESAPADAKAALAPLKKQVSGKAGAEGLLNGNAVLAFVAGRLDKLDPETLPTIVSDSLLIKQAISSGDVAEFMQTPMTIADLANMMELDQGLLNKAAVNGLDPSKLVSPKDFINALGLDAGRVTAELAMLQQKLPVEGIKPYVDRARAMSSKTGLAQTTADSLAPQTQTSDSREPIPGIVPATSLPDSISSAIEIPVPMELSGQVAAGQMAAMSAPAQIKPNLNPVNNNIAMHKQDGITQTGVSKPGISEDPADLLMRQARVSGRNIMSQGALLTPDAVSDLAMPMDIAAETSASSLKKTMDTSTKSLAGDAKILPDMNPAMSLELNTSNTSVGTDPFANAGQMMDSKSKLNIEFGGDGINQRSIQEHLLAQGLDVGSIKKESLGESSSKSSDVSLKSGEIGLGTDPLNDPRINTGFALAREGLSAAAQTATAFGSASFTGDDSKDGDASQDFAGQYKDQASDVASALANGATTAREAAGAFAEKLSNAPKTHNASPLAAKILGHAQMMLKNGGGSMSVNVEAPGIGKVDVAINLINNQLDVRIITASDQARDIISKEITGLRDGLTQQGISLRGLEVGKAGDSSPRHFSGQGQQQFGQGARDQQATYNDMREYVQSFKNTYIPRVGSEVTSNVPASTRWANTARPLLGDKRLEIRV